MAGTPSQIFSGSCAINGSVHSLIGNAAGPLNGTLFGVWALRIDISDLAIAEEIEIIGWEKVRSGDTQRGFYNCFFNGPRGTANSIHMTPAFGLGHGWDFTARASAGTFGIVWSIWQL